MNRTEFDFPLPAERIAQEPICPRDHSKLMVLNREDGSIAHRRFHELGNCLRAEDVLVLNVTRVFPARLRGRKRTGGKAEALLLEPLVVHPHPAPSPLKGEGTYLLPRPTGGEGGGEGGVVWKALVRGTPKATELVFAEGLTAQMTQRLENGEWMVRFSRDSIRSYLDRYGEMPLPPYIKRREREISDQEHYQTVFAREEGSIAAPTAGFHFTAKLLEELRARGVTTVEVVLHVGWGTFRPLRAEQVERHAMLPERFEVSKMTAEALTVARRERRRIIAVGTTTVRTLESTYDAAHGSFCAGSGETNLFIYPGYHFKAMDALITNFHLPHSTPLLLACAFYSDERYGTYPSPSPLPQGARGPLNTSLSPTGERVQGEGGEGEPPFSLKSAYEVAVHEGYRFYSYGDAMLIL